MKSKYWVLLLLLAVVLLALSPKSTIMAQEDPPIAVEGEQDRADITPLIGYQGRLVENGVPVTGDREMTFKLRHHITIMQPPFWTETKTVAVKDGLFQTTLGDTTPLLLDRIYGPDTWLSIAVDGNNVATQRLLGAPYALSLLPGAWIGSEVGVAFSDTVLNLVNNGTGSGLYVQGKGSHLAAPVLKAESKSSDGIAIWAVSNSTDTTIVASNNGTGPLFKAFGGDGGNHEFIIRNDGTVEQDLASNGLVKAGVVAYCGSSGSVIDRSFPGGISIANGPWWTIRCEIDLGFDITQRFWSVQSLDDPDLNANCVPSGVNTILFCWLRSPGGSNSSGDIMLLVY